MPVRVGPFTLEALLGQGGVGQVWRARHRAESFDVAVKIVLADSETARVAFRAEVHAVAALDHPNVVAVYDTGQLTARAAAALELQPGSPWLAMELAERSLVAAHAELEWPARLRVLEAVLAGLAHAHARGVVHRDLKPGNILLGARSGDVVLADFGLAWALGRAGGVVAASGTPPYMAPEQVRAEAERFGPWTDLYAVGCLAYLLAAGTPPFGRGVGARHHLRAHLTRPPPPLPDGAPDGFEEWMRILLRKDPQRRFQRAADAAHALAAIRRPRGRPRRPRAAVDEDATTVAIGAVDVEATEEAPMPAPSRAPIPEDWRPGVRPPNADPQGLVVGLGLVGLRETPIVGREPEQDALWADLLAVTRGEARGVVIRGPPGRGRRRLLRWLCERAHEVGAAEVFRAEHHAIESEGDGVAPMLRGVDGELAGPARIDALLRAIRTRADPRAPVVALHEVQWGAEALELATEGLRRGWPILWLLTCRDDARIAIPPGFRVVDLPPLSESDHHTLVRTLLPLAPALAARVEDRTRGEPAFAVQLLRAWVERGWLVRRPGGFRLAVPERQALVPDLAGVWRDQVEAFLARRPVSARRALELAAALGGRVLRSEWRAACREAGVPARDELLERLAAAGLAALDPDHFQFREPALAEALLAAARDSDRLGDVHLACARALARRGDSVTLRLAQHLVAAEAWEEALPHLQRAGGRASRSGRQDVAIWAIEMRAKALDVLGVPEEDERRFLLDRDRSDVLRAVGDYAEAERVGLRAIERGRRHGFATAVALSHQGMLLLLQGRHDDAEPWLRESLDEAFREGDDGQRAYVLRALARVLAGRGRLAEATRLCEESLAITRQLKDPKGVGYTLVLLADLEDRAHRHDDALARIEQAIAVFDHAGMPGGVAQARQHRGNLLMRLGDLAEAGVELRTAMDALHRDGWAEWYVAATFLAWVELLQGRTESADRLLARAEDQARRSGGAGRLGILLGQLVVAARQHRRSRWDALLSEIRAFVGDERPDPRHLWLVGRAVEAVADDPERAFALGELARQMERT